MNWFITTLSASIGKKVLMAISGLCFCGFLIMHLAGNLTLYGGRDAFNTYAEKLHSLGPLLTVAELGLLGLALLHVGTGLLLFLNNLKARPERYVVSKSAGGRTISSATMPYTGLLMLLFIVFHLFTFSFVDKSQETIYDIVSRTFASPVYVFVYIIAMVIVALHVRHGLWSAFQTLGASHPKYMPLIMGASLLFGLLVAAGFGFLPVFVALAA